MRAALCRSDLALTRTAALKLSLAVIVLTAFAPLETRAQTTASSAPASQTQGAQTGATTSPAQPAAFKPEELDALLSPVALYPDNLLAQICMASTYPLEIVQAARWQKQNESLKGDQLDAALDMQPWDPSVKGLVQVPVVLQQMNDKLDWTQKLGDAFLAQQADVAASIQRLRGRAQTSGELMSTPQQVVMTTGTGTSQTIVIEQANPEVIYVPSYNPATVYGAWPYPAYPPYPYYPAGYVFGTALAFGAGLAIGGAIWNNNWNWGGGDININSNRNTNISGNRNNIGSGNRQNWSHNASHRQGVGYRDQATGQKFGRGNASGANARQNFRGFDQGGGLGQGGRGQLGQGGGGQLGGRGGGQLGQGGGGNFGQGGAGQLGGRGGGGGQFGQGNIGNRASFEQRGGANGFSGVGNGAQTRSNAQRGASSRASSARSFGGGGGGGGRGGGGGGRGGGGGGGRR